MPTRNWDSPTSVRETDYRSRADSGPEQEHRVDGRPAMRALLAPIRGKIRIDRFEMLNPKVQQHGDIAVLTYNLVNYEKQQDGTERPKARWNSTAVFRRLDGAWRTIHSHWSYTKPDLKR